MRKILAAPVAVLALLAPSVAPAAADPTTVILLPGARSAEPITNGPGTTFYAGDMVKGDIYRGDVRRGTAELFLDVPDGVETVGLDLDIRHGLLFAAGGSNKAYVYDIRTRTRVAAYTFGDPDTSLVNDVVLTPYGAWFTDSLQPRLYFVPSLFGHLGRPHTLPLTGCAAGTPGVFNLNGIESTPSGGTLLVAPASGELCTINPLNGSSRAVADVTVPFSDSMVLDGRDLWATHFDNTVTRLHLSDDLTSGTLEATTSDDAFGFPLGIEKFDDRLAIVNGHLDTGVPPTNPTYEVVVIDADFQ